MGGRAAAHAGGGPLTQVVFHRLARAEAGRAARRLGRKSPGLDARLTAAVGDAAARIATNPAGGAPAFGPFRWVKTRRFKYLLYYGPTAPGVCEVFAVAHASRRPGYWVGRTRRP